MALIVKKLVPIYAKKDNVPKKYLNLKKTKYVTTFKFFYPNIPEILQKEYGLKQDQKIVVFWMKEIALPHFNKYRTPFKKIYSGPVSGLMECLKNKRK